MKRQSIVMAAESITNALKEDIKGKIEAQKKEDICRFVPKLEKFKNKEIDKKMKGFKPQKEIFLFKYIYNIEKHFQDGPFTAQMLGHSYDQTELELRKTICAQLEARGMKSNLQSCIFIEQKSCSEKIDWISEPVVNMINSYNKVNI